MKVYNLASREWSQECIEAIERLLKTETDPVERARLEDLRRWYEARLA